MISSSVVKRSGVAPLRRALSRHRFHPTADCDLLLALRSLGTAPTNSSDPSKEDKRRTTLKHYSSARHEGLVSPFLHKLYSEADPLLSASRPLSTASVTRLHDSSDRLWAQQSNHASSSNGSILGEDTLRSIPGISDVAFERLRMPESYAAPGKAVIPSRGAMKQLMYTSTMRAIGSSDFSPEFQKTMHAVVHRACFSTKPSDSSSDSSSSGSGLSKTTQTSSAFSTTTTSPTDDKKPMLERAQEAVVHATTAAVKALVNFFIKLPGVMWFYLTHPSEFRNRLIEIREAAKKEAHHYWMGSKLLVADVQTAYKLLTKTLQGSPLTRRERKQLLRTVSDLFRLVPFSMFVLIPFMEFALPLALRLFPNMLPSTFQDSLKAEENMKRELKSRIAMAQFFQETLQDLVKEQKKHAAHRREKAEGSGEEIAAKKEESAASMLAFLEKARSGEMVPPDVLIQYATYFQDELTLDNMPRMQLINMCKYMSIPPYGSDSFLRFQLRHRIRTLKEDDQRILWEGIDSLTKMELREACQERGMRSTGLSKDAYKRALQQWLDLSVNKNVPVALLIMSRTFYLREEMTRVREEEDTAQSLAGLADAISGLDKDVINEVVLEVATAKERSSDPEVIKLKLEVLEQQNELIREEQQAMEAASKLKKEHQEKERGEKEREHKKEKAEESVSEEPPHPSTSTTAVAEDKIHIEPALETMTSPDATAQATDEKTFVEGVEEAPEPEKAKESEEKEYEEERELSTQEIEAISQLVSPDPVNKEREELERIKAAMKEEMEEKREDLVIDDSEAAPDESQGVAAIPQEEPQKKSESALPLEAEEADKYAAEAISKMEGKVEKESQEAMKHSLGEALAVKVLEEQPDRGDKSLDKAISRLKSKIESMVDKIEHQLTDVQGKIGDKLHFLDKDMDGILSKEETALCLQQVLKRDISFEEAMEIANEIDENQDGVFTVAEFVKWVETSRLVKYAEEGRDLDRELSDVAKKHKDDTKSHSTQDQ